jgi:predicted O-methyltransferase YrrM
VTRFAVQFDEVAALVEGVPYISAREGGALYEFILRENVTDILELGFAHGASTCYMAAALDERKAGRITTIDLHDARGRQPSLIHTLQATGLTAYVDGIFCDTYTWELMKLIDRQTREGRCAPTFDFCYIDGAHTWDTDGLAFFLVDKLLRPGGWLLFDDLHWTLSSDPDLMAMPSFASLPEEQKSTPQIAKVYELLVCQHAGYDSLRVDDNWGWARKRPDGDPGETAPADVLDRIYGSTLRRDVQLTARRVASTAFRRGRHHLGRGRDRLWRRR